MSIPFLNHNMSDEDITTGKSQYCSFAYVKWLQSVGIQISMSAPGQPTQNARMESFLKTVKCEEVYVHHYQTFEEAQARLQTFLEDVYNAKRLHSS